VFTGIIEETGVVLRRVGTRLVVSARAVLEGSEVGASVAVSGACLTVVDGGPGHLGFDLGPETLARTTLGNLESGQPVNLERPLRLGAFVGGHLVLGHVDGVGVVDAMEQEGETARVRIRWQDPALGPLLIPKGSVAVDGVSLTVARLDRDAFEVMLIPHTLDVTTLGSLKPGERVNLEMDVLGKYVQRFLAAGREGA
jgi:riboflavin synthase